MALIENTPSIFSKLFHIREQTHSFLDIFESNQFKIEKYLSLPISLVIQSEKSWALSEMENYIWQLDCKDARKSTLCTPLKKYWLSAQGMARAYNRKSILTLFMQFENELKKSCIDCLISEKKSEDCAVFLLSFLKMTHHRFKCLENQLEQCY